MSILFFQDDFGSENVDLYDDVIAAPSSANNTDSSETNHQAASAASSEETNGNTYSTQGNNITPNVGRRHQLYVGNLTWVSGNLVCSLTLQSTSIE